MKNSTVRKMYREQFNIPEEVEISVRMMYTERDCAGIIQYNFDVEWWRNDSLFKTNVSLPHLNVIINNY